MMYTHYLTMKAEEVQSIETDLNILRNNHQWPGNQNQAAAQAEAPPQPPANQIAQAPPNHNAAPPVCVAAFQSLC